MRIFVCQALSNAIIIVVYPIDCKYISPAGSALPLDSKKRPLSDAQVISMGTANGVSIHPRDVFAIAVRWNASAIVVAHNHPIGSPAPSKRDDELTWGLYAAGKMMGIPLVDHIVLGSKSFYSYADNTRLSQ